MQDIKIDLVYLWVDGNDKEWQRKRNFWAEKSGLKEEISLDICRYADNQELKYSLRSAEMYAPWINKIFIITNGQIPKWLNPNHPKIRMVTHEEIMPKKCLPTFNSEAIETCIANIPDLSEYFLCANDDKFFASKVFPNYFFDENNNPIVNMRFHNWSEDDIRKSLYKDSYCYTVKVFNEKYATNIDYRSIEPFHCIEAYRKSYYLECKREFLSEFSSTARKKFRTKNSIQHPIVDIFMVENKNSRLRMNPSVTEQIFEALVENLYLPIKSYEEMIRTIHSKTPKLLCINDGNYISDNDRNNLKFLLEELFPEKQAWELDYEDEGINPINEQALPVVFSFNDIYSKNFAVTFRSLIKNSNKSKQYDIVVFHTEISEKNQEMLKRDLPSNFSLRFFDISQFIFKYFKDFNLVIKDYWSKEIYYRILIPLIMPKYKKVLYLDSDVIVQQDISSIFDINFENNEILAVIDSIAPVLNLEHNKDRLLHIKKILKIQKPERYFNSGLILFDIKKINTENYIERLKNAKQVEKLLFPDQDILNKIFSEKVKLISQSWNYCCGTLIWHPSYLNEITGEFKKDFISAHNAPKIIHYTSPKKPWNSVDEEFFDIFWKYARETDVYEELMYLMCKATAQSTLVEEMRYINLFTKTETEKKIVFWGASLFLESFLKKYAISNDNILGIIDKNPSRKGSFINQYQIFAPEDLKTLNPDEIIITIVNSAEKRAAEIKDFLVMENQNHIKVKTI